MYYSSGNYEAFARPKKPEGVDNKSAYIVGSGLAALTAACYLVRDGQMKGEHVHVLEKGDLPGGACDGYKFENLGYVMRGGREMDNHFEVMWDLFRSIPSIETEGVSVLDEYYWLNKEDPNYSLCRATVNRGQDAHTDGKFDISDKGAMEIMKLFFTPNEQLQDKKITDFFDDEVLSSNFWLYWRTMFAFENWHSALEMKLYIQRYIHHIGGLPDFTALRFTKYNQYESMILPMCKYITDHGGKVLFDTTVTNIVCDCTEDKKVAKKIEYTQGGVEKVIELTENDLVICTNGCQGDASAYGDQTHAPVIKVKNGEGPHPIRTPQGWLHLAHGVRGCAAGLRYVLYLYMTELERPWIPIAEPGGLLMGPAGEERVGDVSNVLFSNGWIADPDGRVFIYYASSDTRMHVATSTVDRLVDYCLHTPADGLTTGHSVETLKKLIGKNLKR